MEYKIIKDTELDGVEYATIKGIQDGWQCMGPIQFEPKHNIWYREMIRVYGTPSEFSGQPTMGNESDQDNAFAEKVANMGEYTKDLIDVNNISLFSSKGKLYTQFGDKVEKGVAPFRVLELIKLSKHCPIDLKEEEVLKDIESIL